MRNHIVCANQKSDLAKSPHEIITRSGNINILRGRSITINTFGTYRKPINVNENEKE